MSTDSRVRGQRQAPTLVRETFRTSRLLDFCSQRELVKQIGHPVDHWALVILKELVDNALDAAEEASTAPTIAIDVAGGEIIIADNGPGISAEMVADILDFTVRVSSREAYVSPSRGAQGNALKTIVAMGFALDGTKGETVIESRGVAQRIIFKVDQVRQEPKIADHGPLAGLCKLKARPSEAAIFTNGGRLRLAEPAPVARSHLEPEGLR
jgi:DNA topoisomerase VI subunit B